MPPRILPDADEWRAAILASSLDCIITMDAEGKVVEFNTAAERVFGYSAAEAQGREMAELIIPPRYRERHRAGLARHLATGEQAVLGTRIEVEGLRKDGSELPLELAITRLGTSGAPLFTAFIRDLTETRKTQAAQRDSEEKFKQLFEKSSDAIILLDKDMFLECNASTVDMIRCGSKEQLLKLHPSVISPPVQPDGRSSFEKANEMIGIALSTGSHHFEWTHRRADGEDFPCDILLTGIRLGDRQLLYAVLRDITERKRTEAALRASEESYRAIFNASTDAIYIHDVETGVIVDVNREACKVIEYPLEELRGKDAREIFGGSPPFTAEAALEKVRAAAAGEPQLFEWRNTTRTGKHFWCEVNLERTKISGVDRLLATARDITERKRAESELRDRADRVVRYQAALMELTKSDLSDLDAALPKIVAHDACTIDVERVSVWFFNGQKSAIVCRDLFEASEQRHSTGAVIESAHCPRYFAALGTQRTIAAEDAHTNEATSEFTETYLRPLGIGAMLDVPIWRHGEMIGVVCHEHVGGTRRWSTEEQDFAASVADVVSLALEASERKQAEKALRNSEARFRTMFEHSPEALALFEAVDGTFVDCNEAAMRLLRWEKSQLLGKRAWDLAPPFQPDGRSSQAAAMEVVAEMQRTGTARFEWQHSRGDGTTIPAEISISAVEFADRPMFLSSVRDLTSQKEAEAKVARAQTELERRVEERTAELGRANEVLRQQHVELDRANRAKSEFLSRMSHELRTPMNSILGFGQVLARKAASDDQRKHVQHILSAGRHLLELINEVLDISRIEADQLRLSSEPVELTAVVQETVNLVQHLATEYAVTVHDDTRSDGVFVMADRQRLTQVLVNLLSNAVKYNRRGGSVTVTCLQIAGRAQIAVSDNGPGIAAEKLDRLFHPFDRLGAEDSEVEGTGLGLTLSKRLMEHMGGALRVSSKEGVGTDFWVELPLAEDPHANLRTPHAQGKASTLDGGRRFPVLYIEDNLANVSLVETIFTDMPGVDMVLETRGESGIARALELRPALILLDMHLPDQPGDQVLRRLKSDPRTTHIPIIVVSADATPSHIKAMLAAGASHYLTKPLDVDRFVTVVEATLHPTAT
ncbi:MAG TPA: PAS domain S-box protein [Chthoniobacter sp.]|nr:PAS domain S-box protein [Chthoniobacter sp.]